MGTMKLFINMKNLHEQWKKYLEELIDPENIDTSDFAIKDELNSDIWENKNKLKNTIADQLYKIAKDFWDSLDIKWVKILDVTVTGSLANYTWSKYSDIDLHIIIDYNEVDENQDIVQDFLRLNSSAWNKNHNILIKDFEVEIYVQDVNEPHYSTGVYSIKNDYWLTRPTKFKPEIDYENVKKKAANLMNDIDEVYELYANKEYREAHKNTIVLQERIRKFRKSGLEKGGAFSVENLAFKVLRRNEYLYKLSSLKIMSYDKMMSINGVY